MTVRKWFYLIIENERHDDRIGQVACCDTHSFTTATKNTPGVRHKMNMESGEEWTQREVGLGCHDFEDEDDYQQRAGDVLREKLVDIDNVYLREAGLDPEEVLA